MKISCENCLHNRGCFRQEITNDINKWIEENGGCENYKPLDLIANIVRCKDCVYYRTVSFYGDDMHYGYCINLHDDVVGTRNRFELDFCSYAKMKGGEE